MKNFFWFLAGLFIVVHVLAVVVYFSLGFSPNNPDLNNSVGQIAVFSIFFSTALFYIYAALVQLVDRRQSILPPLVFYLLFALMLAFVGFAVFPFFSSEEANFGAGIMFSMLAMGMFALHLTVSFVLLIQLMIGGKVETDLPRPILIFGKILSALILLFFGGTIVWIGLNILKNVLFS